MLLLLVGSAAAETRLDTTVAVPQGSLAVSIHVEFPDSRRDTLFVPDLHATSKALRDIQGAVSKLSESNSVWIGAIGGVVATLIGVALAYLLQTVSRKRAAKAIIPALHSEAVENLDRCSYLVELHCISQRSRTGLSLTAMHLLMNRLASLTDDSELLGAAITLIRHFDRIAFHQDKSLESDAAGQHQAASQSQGVAVAFARRYLPEIVECLDGLGAQVPQESRDRVDLICKLPVEEYCALGLTSRYIAENNGQRQNVEHRMNAMGLQNHQQVLSQLDGKYLTIGTDGDLSLLPDGEKLISPTAWPRPRTTP